MNGSVGQQKLPNIIYISCDLHGISFVFNSGKVKQNNSCQWYNDECKMHKSEFYQNKRLF